MPLFASLVFVYLVFVCLHLIDSVLLPFPGWRCCQSVEVYRQRLLKTDGEPTKMDNNPKNGDDDDDHDDEDDHDHDDHHDDHMIMMRIVVLENWCWMKLIHQIIWKQVGQKLDTCRNGNNLEKLKYWNCIESIDINWKFVNSGKMLTSLLSELK